MLEPSGMLAESKWFDRWTCVFLNVHIIYVCSCVGQSSFGNIMRMNSYNYYCFFRINLLVLIFSLKLFSTKYNIFSSANSTGCRCSGAIDWFFVDECSTILSVYIGCDKGKITIKCNTLLDVNIWTGPTRGGRR